MCRALALGPVLVLACRSASPTAAEAPPVVPAAASLDPQPAVAGDIIIPAADPMATQPLQPPSAVVPADEFTFSPNDALTQQDIRTTVAGYRSDLRVCYNAVLALAPTRGGRVVLRFTIDDGGQVTDAEVTESNLPAAPTSLDECFVATARTWRFKAPANGRSVVVTYPFVLRPGDPDAPPDDGLSRDEIRTVVRSHLEEVRDCYNRGLARDGELTGRVALQFTIAGDGSVPVAVVAESDLPAAAKDVQTCIAAAVKTWSFRARQDGGNVVVTYPFVLVPE